MLKSNGVLVGRMRGVRMIIFTIVTASLSGCATEKAWVPIRYTLTPERGLPPHVRTVAVLDSKVNEVTDRKWSELAANMLQDMIQDSIGNFELDLKIADRKHLTDVMAEQDLAAAGVTRSTSGSRGQGGSVMHVDGTIESEINVKVETHKGQQTTISGLGLQGGGAKATDRFGRQYREGHGGADIQTREVETVTRNIIVQTTFKLVDNTTNQNLATYAPPPYSQMDSTKASPLFGSAQTEAALTPRDEIIGQAVKKGAQSFVSQILPRAIRFEIPVESSASEQCKLGVKMLRGEDYSEAIRYFRAAIAENPADDRAHYGAAVAYEAMGDHTNALAFYKSAFRENPAPQYRAAKTRLDEQLSRIVRTDAR